jgi:DNA-binding beta-propeller fold protein YncE
MNTEHRTRPSVAHRAGGRRSKRALTSRLPAAAVTAWILLGSAQAAAAPHPFIATFGSAGTSSGQFAAPTATAVDQSTGDVYVADSQNFRIQKFDAAGNFILMFGKGVDLTHPGDICTAESGDVCQAGTQGSGGGTQFSTPTFVAVDNSTGPSAGNVYVGDTGTNTISKFDSSGHFRSTNTGSGAPSGSLGELRGIAVDSLGNLWATAEYPSNSEVLEFDQTASLIQSWNPNLGGGVGSVGINSHGEVYVSKGRHGQNVFKYDSVGHPLAITPIGGPGFEETVRGLTLDPASDELYVAAAEGRTVFRFAPSCNSFCRPTESFGTGPLSEASGLSIDATSNRVYVADSAANDVAVFGVAPGPPVIESETVSVTATNANITAQVAPYGHSTTCVLQYVPDAGFREAEYAHATSVPCSPAALGSGFNGVSVAASLSGLQEGTTYHYRVQATSTAGTTTASDRTFLIPAAAGPRPPDTCPNATLRTGASANLPDCRAYELVTPAAKNGAVPFGSVLGEAVADSNAFLISSLGAFGAPPDSASAFGANYLATRDTATGWKSSPIDPPASQYENDGLFNAPISDLSRDFQKALFTETPVGRPAIDRHLVLREPSGTFVDVGPMVPPSVTDSYQPTKGLEEQIFYSGGSGDLSRVFFTQTPENNAPVSLLWPGDSTGATHPSLYEYIGAHHTGLGGDVPALVAVDDSGHPLGECGTVLGGRQHAEQAISADGTTVLFTVEKECGAGGAGSPVDELFARIKASHTVPISQPRVVGYCQTLPSPPCADAVYQGASEDGSKVVFTTTQPELPGEVDATNKLYVAEIGGRTDQPAVQRTIQLSAGDSSGAGAQVQGALNVSNDGTRVYFVAKGVLSPNANGQGQHAVGGADNLYVSEPDPGHPGQPKTTYITSLAAADESDWTESTATEITPDGRYLLLKSTNSLTPDAAGSASQLYRYDSATGALVRISVGANGFNQNGNVSSNSAAIVTGRTGAAAARASASLVSISDDGAYVFFASSAGLTPQAIDDPTGVYTNVYEYHNGHVSLISDGQDRQFVLGSTVQLLGASASGSDVYFRTADQLLSQDTDTQFDIYDARINGGFPAPTSPSGCEPEGCRGALTGAPGEQTPASALLSGPGNLTPPTPPVSKPKTAAQVRAEQLTKALKACRTKRNRHKRTVCEHQAHKRYGPTKAKKASHTTTTHKGGK